MGLDCDGVFSVCQAQFFVLRMGRHCQVFDVKKAERLFLLPIHGQPDIRYVLA